MANRKILSFVALLVAIWFYNSTSFSWAEDPTTPVPVPAGSVSSPTTPVATGAPAAQPQGMGMTFLTFGLMFAVAYFLMIRPQQKKMKKHQELLKDLQHGDNIVTASGILGKVTGITEKVVTLEIDKDVKIRLLKSQVAQIVKGPLNEISP